MVVVVVVVVVAVVGTREVGTITSKNTTHFLQARNNSQPSELRVPQLASMLCTWCTPPLNQRWSSHTRHIEPESNDSRISS